MKHSKNLLNLLTKGLSQGFAGKTDFKIVKRGSFELESSHYEEKGAVYHDEWLGNRTSGGQELVKQGRKVYTRLYGGGSITYKELKQLGISEKQISNYLKNKLLELSSKTRLRKECRPKPDGQWQYSYSIIKDYSNIPFTVGEELIKYRGKIVFVHFMLLCPVE